MSIMITLEADNMADLLSQLRMLVGQANMSQPQASPPEGADVNVDRKANETKKRVGRPPKAKPEPVEEEVEEEVTTLDELFDEEEAVPDPVELMKLKTDTIAVLQDAFTQGKITKLRKLLMTYGDGAKSFPEVDPVKFIDIDKAVKAGALNG